MANHEGMRTSPGPRPMHIAQSADAYADWDEPTIPSMPALPLPPPLGWDDQPPPIMRWSEIKPIEVMAFTGILTGALLAAGALFESPTSVALAGIFMVIGHGQALVRRAA